MRKTHASAYGFHTTHTCSPSLASPAIAFASQREKRVYAERDKGAVCMYKSKRAMMALEMELEEQDELGLAH